MSAVGDARKRLAEGLKVAPQTEHFQWIRDNLPLDNLGHITSCSAFGDDCGCATLAARIADLLAEARAEERERVAQAIEARGRVCSDAHGMECIGGVAYRDAARIAREVRDA